MRKIEMYDGRTMVAVSDKYVSAPCEQCVLTAATGSICGETNCITRGVHFESPTAAELAYHLSLSPTVCPEDDTAEAVPIPKARYPGRKDDTGKLDLTLLFDDCPHALEAVAEVLQWAVTQKLPVPYTRGSWQGVEPFQPRYRAAMYRHQMGAAKAVLLGGSGTYEGARDAETGLLELAHIATDAIFQLEMAIRKEKAAE